MTPRYYLMRVQRYGPLVPARLQYLDHEPGEPSNKRDRWPALLPFVDIAGEVRPPEELTERGAWQAPHWKFAQEIDRREYERRFAAMRQAEADGIDDPVLRPRRRVDPRQLPLPDFSKENADVG